MGLQIKRSSTNRLSNIIVTLTAVFALVAQPIYGVIESQIANAVGAGNITNEQQLIEAAADSSVTVLNIKANFDVSKKINLSGRNITIDGNGNTLTFVGDAAGWQGNYFFQAYRNTTEVKNLNFIGGDAALFANGAILKLSGNVTLSGQEFGGIETSNNNAKL